MAHAVRVSEEALRADAGRDVVDHLAVGVDAAVARVAALLADTGQQRCALRVEHALGPAADVRVAAVFGQADAGGRRAAPLALGVVAARGRPARVAWLLGLRRLGDGLRSAAGRLVRVALETRRTAAASEVADDVAEGVAAAGAGARVAALLALADERVGAVRVGETFRSTADVRVAPVLGQTGAHGHAVVVAASGVLGARRREARVLGPRRRRWNTSTDTGQPSDDRQPPCSMQSGQAHMQTRCPVQCSADMLAVNMNTYTCDKTCKLVSCKHFTGMLEYRPGLVLAGPAVTGRDELGWTASAGAYWRRAPARSSALGCRWCRPGSGSAARG